MCTMSLRWIAGILAVLLSLSEVETMPAYIPEPETEITLDTEMEAEAGVASGAAVQPEEGLSNWLSRDQNRLTGQRAGFSAPEELDYLNKYARIINEYEADYDGIGYLTYELINLDGNDIPELTIGRRGSWYAVYSYLNGEPRLVLDWNDEMLTWHECEYAYLPGQNMVRYWQMDWDDTEGEIIYISTAYGRINEYGQFDWFLILYMEQEEGYGNDDEQRWHYYRIDEGLNHTEISLEDWDREYDSLSIEGDFVDMGEGTLDAPGIIAEMEAIVRRTMFPILRAKLMEHLY